MVDLAKTIYEEKAWDRCPILADAIMDAGCEHDEVLDLLTNQHDKFSRGVWLIDKLCGYQ